MPAKATGKITRIPELRSAYTSAPAEHAAYRIGRIPRPQLLNNVGAVEVDRARANPKITPGFLARRAFHQECEDHPFPLGEQFAAWKWRRHDRERVVEIAD